MTRIIAIANQKGGTGKTTTSVNITAGLAREGKKVLFIDIDPQANASAVFFGASYVAGPEPGLTIYEILMEKASVAEVRRKVELEGNERYGLASVDFDIIPAHINLAVAEQELISVFQREARLQHALKDVDGEYDFIIIDCPPSLGLLTINSLVCAGEILIPIEPGVFPLIGLGLLQKTIETVKRINPSLTIQGLLPVRVNRTNLASSTIEELENAFGDLVLPPVPERVAIGEAHAEGLDIFLYAPRSDSATAYQNVVKEIIERG